MHRDTIYALSSGRPPAAIAVVRVSGARAHAVGAALAGTLPEPRSAVLRTVRDASGGVLDDALLLRFDGPASATGEDVVEFHCHGGRAVVAAVLEALAGFEGLREAQPGEYTRRAFENGRIDLTEAEGLADLLEAETESQRRTALLMAEGGLSRQVARWRERLLELSARAEAAIDYADEDGTDDDGGLAQECGFFAAELDEWLQRPRVEPLKEGVRVVVAGPPNAGKSSLVNALAGVDRAIVTPIPGTTRDSIEVPLSLGGVPVALIDTAGLRESDDPVETIGISRARRLASGADILVWLGAMGDAPDHPRLLLVQPKIDLPATPSPAPGAIGVSSVTGEGLDALLTTLSDKARIMLPAPDQLAMNRRQAAALEEVCDRLRGAQPSNDIAINAELLRSARAALDRLSGHAGIEDVLDALFGRFCLGK